MTITFDVLNADHVSTNSGRTISSVNYGAWRSSWSSAKKSAGKWYWEISIDSINAQSQTMIGIATALAPEQYPGQNATSRGFFGYDGKIYYNTSSVAYGSPYTAGDVIGVALDLVSGMLYFSINGIWQNSGDPETATNPAVTGLVGDFFPVVGLFEYGNTCTGNFAQSDLVYVPPSGFLALDHSSINRVVVDMLYGDEYVNNIAVCEMIYGLRLGAATVMYYGDCLNRLALLNMHYGDCPLLRRGLVLKYDDLLLHRQAVEMAYALPPVLTAAMEMRYGIADTELRGYVELQYELLDRDLLRGAVDMPYLIQGDGLVKQVGATVTIGGRPVSVNHIAIEPDLEMYVIPAELHLTREADFVQLVEGEAVVIVVDDVVYNLVVDDARVNRSERGSISWIVEALSPAIRLSSTWSRPLLTSWEPTTCYAVVNELAGDLGPVEFHIDDFPVVGLYANDEDAVEVIRKVLDTVDARLQSAPDGSLYVIYEEPADWDTRAPDYYISSERNFLSQDNTTIKRPGYNAFLIGNQLTADDRLWTEQRQLSGSLWEILGFQTPWDNAKDLVLTHSGGPWVSVPEYMGVVEELYPPLTEDAEVIEFVKGYAQTSRPIYDDPQLLWLQTQLGAILFAEDGWLEAEVKDGPTEGYGLAEVRYLTRYHLWRVRNSRPEPVQYLLREVIE